LALSKQEHFTARILKQVIAQFTGIKGARTHRIVGWIWVGLMMFIAASSFWIGEIRKWGAWSPIHLLGVLIPTRDKLPGYKINHYR